MIWENRDINGILVSKDLIPLIEYVHNVMLLYKTPDKRYISEQGLNVIAWYFISEPC